MKPGIRKDNALRVLFFMRSINYDRHFEGVIRLMGERGHRVHVVFDVEKKGAAGDSSLFDSLTAEFPNLTVGYLPERRDLAWASYARHLRLGIDFMRFLEPGFEGTPALRRRAEERAPALVTKTARRPGFRSPAGRRRVNGVLRALEGSVPPGPDVEAFLDEQDPDVVLVTPLVGLGSPQGDYLRAAKAKGIPTCLLVASWDNLTNKGVIRDVPERTVVWNEAQAREAVELHGIPAETVVATGAHTYDHWFDWEPSTTREDFCRTVGLEPDRPYLLYLCSSSFIAPDEARFVEDWVSRLRESDDERLRDVGVLIRPHPANAQRWPATLSDPGRTVVWPPAGAMPTDQGRKNDYYDSIHHCQAVVGVNTSALIESAIVGRPVYTVLAPQFQDTQEGTIHFAHLTTAGDAGILTVAHSFDEHVEQIGEAVSGNGAGSQRARRFVESFVRPHGIDVPAAPRVVDLVEELATTALTPEPRLPRQALTRTVSAPFVRVAPPVASALAPLGVGRKRPRSRPRPARSGDDTLRILLVLDQPGLLLHFDETVAELTRRGHEVHLQFGKPDKFPEGLEVLDRDDPRLTVIDAKARDRRDDYFRVAGAIRAAADNVHYLDPALAGAEYSRAKWRELWNPPLPLRLLLERETLGRRKVRALLKLLALLEEAVPSDPAIERAIEKIDPDVVLVSPLVIFRGYQTDYLKAAQRLGRRTGVLVTSWDNLTSKGLLRYIPDRVMLWNETQRREATEHHAVPDKRIVVTGAQPFDRWFDRGPRSDREQFCARFGLPADKPYVMFVGSTRQNLDNGADVPFVRRWVETLRASDDPLIRELSVLVRPHPRNFAGWLDVDFSDMPNVAIWNRDSPLPIQDDDRADYFDSIYHSAAMVGINSSAMVEAAIVGRPVHTILMPEWHTLQRKLIHYHYLLPENGGFLREAATIEEHVGLLAADLRDPEPSREQQRRFVRAFVRPRGEKVPATPALAEAIQDLGNVPGRTSRPKPELFPLRCILAAGVLGPRVIQEGHQQVAKRGPAIDKALQRRARALREEGVGEGRRVPAGIGLRAAQAMETLGISLTRSADRSRMALKRRGVKSTKPPKADKPPKPAKPPKAAKPPKPPKPAKPPKPEKKEKVVKPVGAGSGVAPRGSDPSDAGTHR